MHRLIKQLQEIRERAGVSQEKLGKKLGLPQSHISKIESGRCDLRLSNFIEISHILGQEIMLIPKELMFTVEVIISGEKKVDQLPRWQADEPKE